MILTRPGDWPLRCEPADEFAGDEWVWEGPSGYPNFRLLGGGLDLAQYAETDARFMDLYGEALRGRIQADDPALLGLAQALGLVGRRTHDRRPPRVAPLRLGEQVCCDAVEDYCPDLAVLGLDRFLGPWADTPLSQALRAAAVASAAFLPALDAGVSPMHRWDAEHPRPPLELRASAAAVARVPAMLWAVDNTGWTPLLPLAPQLRPSGPVRAQPPALGPERGRSLALARVYPTAAGEWVAFGAIRLGGAPPVGRLVARLELELLRLRRHERRSTWEDLLRRRPEVLYRSCAGAWWRLTEAEVVCA